MTITIEGIIAVLGAVSLVVAMLLTVFSTRNKSIIDQQEQLIDVQKKRLDTLVESDKANGTAISELRGQVDVLKTIPLQDISLGQRAVMDNIAQITETQHSIIRLLQEAKAPTKSRVLAKS